MAVFTRLTKKEIEDLLQLYSISPLKNFEGILQGVDNTNYKIETDSNSFILTVFEKRIDPTELPFFLGFMDHLVKAGINCPSPIKMKDGRSITEVEGKKAALFSFLRGKNVAPSDITAELCGELGAILARMHVAGQKLTMTRPNSMGFAAWKQRIDKVGIKANDIHPDLASLLQAELKYLQENWPADLPQGAIHADLFPDNVFTYQGHIDGVIDFYFAATDFLAYDLTIVMNAWCFDDSYHFSEDRWAKFLGAYEEIRPLSSAEKSSYQILCRGAAMRFLSSRLHDLVFHDPHALVMPKPPTEYIKKLDFHCHDRLF